MGIFLISRKKLSDAERKPHGGLSKANSTHADGSQIVHDRHALHAASSAGVQPKFLKALSNRLMHQGRQVPFLFVHRSICVQCALLLQQTTEEK